jgi:hypothetical protein
MKYPKKTAHGDAGEFFFAYQIASILKWPCRLFDIDIGIDAQVEILDEKGVSSGKFVAFQIKTTNAEDHSACSYVDEEHLAYWRSLDVPVFVVLVDLPKRAMYLRQIIKSEAYPTTDKGSIRIEFDTVNGRFQESSSAVIQAAADEAALADVREYLVPVREGIETIRNALGKARVIPEPDVLIEIMMRRIDWKDSLARAEALARNLRTGAEECSDVEAQLGEALAELREFMIDWKMDEDWDDGKYRAGEIKKFIEESR